MMAAQTATVPRNIAEILLKEGLINKDQFQQGLREHDLTDRPLARIFVEMGAISEGVKLGILQKRCSCELVSLAEAELRPEAAILVSHHVCEKYHLVPLRIQDGHLYVAMEDPTDVLAIEAVETMSGMPVVPLLARSAEVSDAIQRLPDLDAEDEHPHGGTWHLLSKISLPIACAILPVAFTLLLLFHPEFQTFWKQLRLDAFEQVLFFVLAWCAWAIFAYWFDDVIFGQGRRTQVA